MPKRQIEQKDIDIQMALVAASRLVMKMDEVHVDPAYLAVWQLVQLHLGKYNGPRYFEELEQLRDALMKVVAHTFRPGD